MLQLQLIVANEKKNVLSFSVLLVIHLVVSGLTVCLVTLKQGEREREMTGNVVFSSFWLILQITKGQKPFHQPTCLQSANWGPHKRIELGCNFCIYQQYMRVIPTSLRCPRTRCSLSIFFSLSILKSPRLLHNQTWQHHDLHHRKLPPRPSKSSSLTHRHHSPAVGRKKRFGFDLEWSASCICLYFFFFLK